MMKKSVRVRHDEGRFAQAEQYALATVAFVLADAMESSGLTQRQLADRLGITEGRISQILHANGNPTVRSLARIADALNCKIKIRFAELDAIDRRPDVAVKVRTVTNTGSAALLAGQWLSPRVCPHCGRPPEDFVDEETIVE